MDDVCDSHNHSIKEWVKIGTKFTFKIHVTNLSQVELGALLWLLSLNRDQRQPDHFLRLNGGKPLGFGSVSPRIAATDLRPGARWKEYYFDLAGSQDTPDQDSQKILHDEAVKAYICAVVQAYGDMAQTEKLTDDRLLETFGKVPFIDSFLAAARGLDGPIHYPRTSTAPDPQGENFKWFDPKNSQSLPLLKTDGMDRLLYTHES